MVYNYHMIVVVFFLHTCSVAPGWLYLKGSLLSFLQDLAGTVAQTYKTCLGGHYWRVPPLIYYCATNKYGVLLLYDELVFQCHTILFCHCIYRSWWFILIIWYLWPHKFQCWKSVRNQQLNLIFNLCFTSQL